METKFEIGDVVHWEEFPEEYTVTKVNLQHFPNHIQIDSRYAVHVEKVSLVRRASAQREGGSHLRDCVCQRCVKEPPQPAPMTRAARVLAKMEQDPYAPRCSDDVHRVSSDANPRNEAARLRMAKMSLDRPLDAERARWERLVCAVHPVTSRAVRGRR